MLDFDLVSQPYQFDCPPDSNWLPCQHTLFEEHSDIYAPSLRKIESMTDVIKSKWTAEERRLRRLRATIARQLGVCRNH